ncbi:hypothetical protein R9X47_01275 [Wukongibacter baidiensis]|uniref:hypothetical protein n=1 Tax=Wukongibacter baidiensis TaxID=1723361 RepID=UPI003D7F585F
MDKNLENKVNKLLVELGDIKLEYAERVKKDNSHGRGDCHESWETEGIDLAIDLIKKYFEQT